MGTDVLVLYNTPLQADAAGASGQDCRWLESDAGVLNEVRAVAEALDRLGLKHQALGVRTLEDVRCALEGLAGTVVFNLVERLDGAIGDFNAVPDLCVRAGCGCTGSDTASLVLTFDKARTKQRLAKHGLRSPEGVCIRPGRTVGKHPAFPLIVKPLCADGGEGIDEQSVVRAEDMLAGAVARVHETGQVALVEQYIEGREFSAPILRMAGALRTLPLSELDFSLFPRGRVHIADYAVKWIPGTLGSKVVSARKVPAPLDEPTAERVRACALGAWNACGCGDYGRVDMRMDPSGQVYVLEVNTNCDLSPLAAFPAALKVAGIAFEEFVRGMVQQARRQISSSKHQIPS